MSGDVLCFCASDCGHHKEGERCSKPVSDPCTVAELLDGGKYSDPYKVGICEECWRHHKQKSAEVSKSS
jgi:hypothetical protein